ncbi:MAG: trigger factor [Campylobacterota bacterium]|nr:trigger factor [Campylobacterota bacterium]
MEFTANKIDGANATIAATITTAEVAQSVEKIAKQLSKTAKIDGFRKGKVPVAAVKKQYGEKLTSDGEAELLRQLLDDGLKDMGIANDALIGEPQVSKFDKGEDKIDVEVTIAMRPEIELGDYNACTPDFEKPSTSDEEIDSRIKDLAEAQAPLIDVEEDRELVSGDSALIDFNGSVDGVAFDGGKAENFSLRLGSGQFIPGFEDQVVGMKKGEEKVVKVTFPENYGGKELAGKDAEFKVKVNGIQVKEAVEIDDELAKKMLPGDENATVDLLKEKVKEQLDSEKLSKLYNEDLKPKLLEALVNSITLDLPKFVVEQEMDMALNNRAKEMSEAEINEIKDDAEKVKALREEFRDDASRSVKATFIIDELAKKEDITANEQEVMQTIYYEAMQSGQDPSAVYEQYKTSGYLPAMQMAMVEDKVLSKLLTTKMEV